MPTRMPAEFEQHAHTWLLWPLRPDNWRGDGQYAQEALLLLAAAIVQFEPVKLGVLPSQIEFVRNRVPTGVQVHPIEYDDIWSRDTGPMCVDRSGSVVALDWRFNSWGGLFESWALDDTVPGQIANVESLRVESIDTVLEGGAVSVDGQGTLLTTEECLLRPNRNELLSKQDYENLFREELGIKKTVWIPSGIAGDETGGHVDNICVFIGPAHVVLAWTDDKNDENYLSCRAAYSVLSGEVDAGGSKLSITKLPLPKPMFITDDEATSFSPSAGTISRVPGTRLAGSYVNLYPVNGGVIVPTFGVETDEVALTIVSQAFPGRKVVGVPSREFLLGGGGPHCLTQQIPPRRCVT